MKQGQQVAIKADHYGGGYVGKTGEILTIREGEVHGFRIHGDLGPDREFDAWFSQDQLVAICRGTKRNLQCTCCGSGAGRFHQHNNRDTGYGICRKCINWFRAEKRETEAEILSHYGVEGVNYATQEQADALKRKEDLDWTRFKLRQQKAHRSAELARERTVKK